MSYSLSLFIFLHLTTYRTAHFTNCCLSCYAETFRKCLLTFRMVEITSTSRSISQWRAQFTWAEILKIKDANLWQACNKCHAEMSLRQTAFTAVPVFYFYPRPAISIMGRNLCCRYVCMYLQGYFMCLGRSCRVRFLVSAGWTVLHFQLVGMTGVMSICTKNNVSHHVLHTYRTHQVNQNTMFYIRRLSLHAGDKWNTETAEFNQ
jgi:hypothetical protein